MRAGCNGCELSVRMEVDDVMCGVGVERNGIKSVLNRNQDAFLNQRVAFVL